MKMTQEQEQAARANGADDKKIAMMERSYDEDIIAKAQDIIADFDIKSRADCQTHELYVAMKEMADRDSIMLAIRKELRKK